MNLFNLIKSKISILDVVSHYTVLKKAGGYWKGRCPFHQEKTPSFTVSPGKDIFYCFGCHLGGDVISFVTKIEHCSAKEAVKILVDQYNITMPDGAFNGLVDQESVQEKQRYYTLCKLFAYWCHENLKQTPSVQEYLKRRSISERSISCFLLGYMPIGLTAVKRCIDYFRVQHQFLVNDLIDANILARSKNVIYSSFEDRIIFPIKDGVGNFCGFGGRIFNPQDSRVKYYNSKETNYFVKGSLLFGLDAAKKAMQASGQAIVVEGYTDCITMVQNGYANTVATLGTACNVQQLKIIARYAHTLFVIYDADQAGKNAMLRLAQLCWQVNLELKVVLLPAGTDPASFLHEGQDLQPLLAKASDILLFFVEFMGHSAQDQPMSSKLATIRLVVHTIASLEDQLKRDLLLQRLSTLTHMSIEALKMELRAAVIPTEQAQNKQPAGADIPMAPVRPVIATPELERGQQRLLCAILNSIELVTALNESYIKDYMIGPLHGILLKVLEIRSTNQQCQFNDLFECFNEYEQALVSKIVTEHDEIMDSKEFDRFMLEIKKQQWKQQVILVKKRIDQASKSGDQQEIKKLLTEFQELKNKLLTT